MTVKSLVQIAIAGLALSLPLAHTSTASARAVVRDHRANSVVRNGPGRIHCSPYYGCYQGGKKVHPTIRDHRKGKHEPYIPR